MDILVPLDRSPHSQAVLPAVKAILQSTGDADVILFAAIDPDAAHESTDRPYEDDRRQTAGQWETAPTVPETPQPRTVETRDQALDRLRARVETELRTIAHEHFPAGRTTIHVRWSDRTAWAIAGAAAELGADMIAMATHGRTGLEHLLMGSIAEEVVREATIPVLLVRPTEFG